MPDVTLTSTSLSSGEMADAAQVVAFHVISGDHSHRQTLHVEAFPDSGGGA